MPNRTRLAALAAALLPLLLAGCSSNNGSMPDAGPVDVAVDDAASPDTTAPDTSDECVELDADIATDTTLDGQCYLVTTLISVTARLQIQAGVTLRFAKDTGLNINSSGTIRAVGGTDKPIRMTGVDPTPGSWRGVLLHNADDVENLLEEVIIEHGGGKESSYGPAANLALTSSGETVRVKLIGVTLRESAGYGLFLAHTADLGQMTGCTLTNNTLGPARVSPHSARFLDDNAFSGNDQDFVVIANGSVTQPLTWPAIDVPYLHEDRTAVDAQLTLAPGVEIHFADKAGLDVSDQGTLTAVGTGDKPIVLRGAEQKPGYWRGVLLHNSDKAGNHLEEVTIADGGGEAFSYGRASNLALTSSGYAVQVKLVNVTLSGSAGYGLFLAGKAALGKMSGCTLTKNALGAAAVTAESVRFLGDNTFTGNTVDQVEVTAATVASDTTWPALDVPYLHHETTAVEAVLTIEPGTTIHFADKAAIWVSSEGALKAIGTTDKPIVMRGAKQTAGSWGGLLLHNSASADNQLEWVTVAHGGGYDHPYGAPANLALTSSGNPVKATVKDCTFTDSAGFGVWYDATEAEINGDVSSANTFTNNASGDVGTTTP